MTLDTIIKAAPDQVSCELAGEAAILNLADGVYYGLDPVGARIWSLLQSPITVAQIRDAILAEYEVDRDTCERDLQALLNDLAKANLIELSNA